MQATPEEKALWQQRIDVWRESGLKQSVWCRQNGVKDYQFLYWKKQLSFRAEKEVQPKNIQPRPEVAKQAAFVPVANWGEFVRQLKYKAHWADRTIAEIDRFFPSSKLCSSCGCVSESLLSSIRERDCPECNAHHDRDINAAKTIKTAGLAGLACGATRSGVAA